MDGFWLGPIKIYYYSLCLLAAVWVGYAVALKQLPKVNLSRKILDDSVAWVLIAGVIGGRLGYLVQNVDYFKSHLGAVWQLSSGGLSIHGAIAGALVALWLTNRQQILNLTDLYALPLLVGQIIGRLGNYFNQELFGYPTQLPWKIFIEAPLRPTDLVSSSYFHPTFAYEMILNTLGLWLLWRIQPKNPGQLTGGFLVVMAISRFITEIWRISDRVVIGLSSAQLISLALLVVGIVMLRLPNNIFKKE